MSYDSSESFPNKRDNLDYDKELANDESAVKNTKVRKRIDDLLDKKQMQKLLDENDEWDF